MQSVMLSLTRSCALSSETTIYLRDKLRINIDRLFEMPDKKMAKRKIKHFVNVTYFSIM